jgi:hypothetical protein
MRNKTLIFSSLMVVIILISYFIFIKQKPTSINTTANTINTTDSVFDGVMVTDSTNWPISQAMESYRKFQSANKSGIKGQFNEPYIYEGEETINNTKYKTLTGWV